MAPGTSRRSIQRIVKVVGALIERTGPDLVVIACNTASTLALAALRERYTIPFVGTVPAMILVVNTPHLKRTLLRRLRHALGQTDEKHGHLRPGYTPERLRELLGPAFDGAPPHLLALLLRGGRHRPDWGMERLGKKSSAKGMVVTSDDLARNRKAFRAYSAVYPFVWAVTRLDALVPASGYMLIAAARRRAS